MTLNPDAQRKAQAEIDLVVGHERLPDWNDRQSLPYVDALVNEVLRYAFAFKLRCFFMTEHRLVINRWRNVTPTAVYHRLMVDDVYNDYFLPAGATVIPNVWYGFEFSICGRGNSDRSVHQTGQFFTMNPYTRIL